MKHLNGKVAFVTGGVSGIGLGITRALLSEGMTVIASYLQEAHFHDATAHLEEFQERFHAVRLDVTDRDAVVNAANQAVRQYGKIHLLCNNAGVNLFDPPIDCATFADWDWVLNVNLHGIVNMLVAFLPYIKAHREGGHVLNVASMAAMLPGPGAGIYTTSKFAVRGLSEALRYALATHNIGVSVFCPGLVQSNIHEAHRNRPKESDNSSVSPDESLLKYLGGVQSLGMDPYEAGLRVLKGIKRNDLFIFSHTDLKDDLSAYFQQILDAFPEEIADPRRQSLLKDRRDSIIALEWLIEEQRLREERNDEP